MEEQISHRGEPTCPWHLGKQTGSRRQPSARLAPSALHPASGGAAGCPSSTHKPYIHHGHQPGPTCVQPPETPPTWSRIFWDSGFSSSPTVGPAPQDLQVPLHDKDPSNAPSLHPLTPFCPNHSALSMGFFSARTLGGRRGIKDALRGKLRHEMRSLPHLWNKDSGIPSIPCQELTHSCLPAFSF